MRRIDKKMNKFHHYPGTATCGLISGRSRSNSIKIMMDLGAYLNFTHQDITTTSILLCLSDNIDVRLFETNRQKVE